MLQEPERTNKAEMKFSKYDEKQIGVDAAIDKIIALTKLLLENENNNENNIYTTIKDACRVVASQLCSDDINLIVGLVLANHENEVKTVFSCEDKRNIAINMMLSRCNVLNEKIIALKPEIFYAQNEKGIGELFADIIQDEFRFNVTTNSWFQFNGAVWIEDKGGMLVSRKAKEFSDKLLQYAAALGDESIKSKYVTFVNELGSLKKRNIMIKEARDKYFMSRDVLDKKDHLINCQNGTYNLTDNSFYRHSPDDLLSKVINAEYDPFAICKEFEKFIFEIMEGNDDKMHFLQKLCGYIICGYANEEKIFILYGPSTRNGKSTFIETIANMLGNSSGYAINIKPESLALRSFSDGRQASGDIARLDGARLVTVSELPQKMILDASFIKTVSGRDKVTARRLYEAEFEFVPKFKLVVNTNHLPVITDNTLFQSERICVVEFGRHFKEHEQDKNLKEKLQKPEVLSGIFNWCIEGFKMYQKEGLIIPDVIKKSIKTYVDITERDTIGEFIQECMIKDGVNCKAKDAYELYREWCIDKDYIYDSKSNFYNTLKIMKLLQARATVDGKTLPNVIVGYSLINYADE